MNTREGDAASVQDALNRVGRRLNVHDVAALKELDAAFREWAEKRARSYARLRPWLRHQTVRTWERRLTTTWHRRPRREPEDATSTLFAREKPDGWTSDQWATPWSVIRDLEQRFGPFDLDPAAQEHTAKAPAFYTIEQDGLSKPWRGRVFCNPPYSKPGPWCDKARQETENGNAELVVMLLPASVDTGWFHDLVLPYAEVQFHRGRVRFIGWEGTPIGSPKAPSILAVYRRAEEVAA